MIRKLTLLLASVGVLSFTLLPASVQAVDVIQQSCQGAGGATACRSNTDQPTTGNSIFGPDGILTRIARLMSYVVGVASVIMIIIGGFRYATASGDPNNINAAKNTILYALVGMVIAASAQGIIYFVLSRL